MGHAGNARTKDGTKAAPRRSEDQAGAGAPAGKRGQGLRLLSDAPVRLLLICCDLELGP